MISWKTVLETFKSSEKTPFFSWKIKQIFWRFTQTVKAFFEYAIINIIIGWAFITFQGIERIFQFIYWKCFGFHNKSWYFTKYSDGVESFGILFPKYFVTFVRKKLISWAIFFLMEQIYFVNCNFLRKVWWI